MEHRQPRSSSAAWQPKQGFGQVEARARVAGVLRFQGFLEGPPIRSWGLQLLVIVISFRG